MLLQILQFLLQKTRYIIACEKLESYSKSNEHRFIAFYGNTIFREGDDRLLRWLKDYRRRTGIQVIVFGKIEARLVGQFLLFLSQDKRSPFKRRKKPLLAIIGHGKGDYRNRTWSIGSQIIQDLVDNQHKSCWVCACETYYHRYFYEGRWLYPHK